MFEIAIILGILVGYGKGGNLERLKEFDPFSLRFIVAGSGAYFLAYLFRSILPGSLIYLLVLSSYILFMSGVFFNRKNDYLLLIMIGLILNFLVFAINGAMPVSFGAVEVLGVNTNAFSSKIASDLRYVPMLSSTKLKFLSAIIPLSRPYVFPAIFSVGDVFMSIGLFAFLQSAMLYPSRHKASHLRRIRVGIESKSKIKEKTDSVNEDDKNSDNREIIEKS